MRCGLVRRVGWYWLGMLAWCCVLGVALYACPAPERPVQEAPVEAAGARG